MNGTTTFSEKLRSAGEVAIPYQISLIDNASLKPAGKKYRRRQVQNTLAEIRKLHEDLNAALITHPSDRPEIHSPNDAFDIIRFFISALDHEEMWVMLLDTRNRVMNLIQLYKGNVNTAQVRIGEVFRQALLDNAPCIIIAHNHPSGDPSPSSVIWRKCQGGWGKTGCPCASQNFDIINSLPPQTRWVAFQKSDFSRLFI